MFLALALDTEKYEISNYYFIFLRVKRLWYNSSVENVDLENIVIYDKIYEKIGVICGLVSCKVAPHPLPTPRQITEVKTHVRTLFIQFPK